MKLLTYLWIFFAGKEPDYSVEIIRRQNLMIKCIDECKTWGDIKNCENALKLYIELPFPAKDTVTAIAIINSHIGWKKLEITKNKVA